MADAGSFMQAGRREIVLGGTAALGLAMSTPLLGSAREAGRARYRVTLSSLDPLRFRVTADVPIGGDRLSMATSYPAELAEMAANGWPTLIRNLAVTDDASAIAATRRGSAGWTLDRPLFGRAKLRYDVDFGIFAAAGWPSPHESAFVDADHVVASCRALFMTTPAVTGADVAFFGPKGWLPVLPWEPSGGRRFQVRDVADLTENMLVFASRPPARIAASGFTVLITSMGHWWPIRSLVQDALGTVLSLQARMMATRQREYYSVLLLPAANSRGEAYRQSFAYSHEGPTAANRGNWANTLAHELFHYWNASRLRGQDYSATQWFQEGFTEYVANLSLLVGGIIGPKEFLGKLSSHVANYGRLITTLEAIGNRKGPPLYSAGALVAFSFDVMIRWATDGRHSIGTFFRNMWRQTDAGERRYSWSDIEAALRATARGSWADYYARHIRGAERLPLDQAFAIAGLKLELSQAAGPQVVTDTLASPQARSVWLGLKSRM